jgi:hypothetical protein
MSKPRRRRLAFADFDQVRSDAAGLRQADYKRAGNWHLGQVCDHLASAIEWSIDGFPIRAPWPIRTLAGPIVYQIMFRSGWMPAGVKVGPRFMPPPTVQPDAAIARLDRTIDRFNSHPGKMADHPLFDALSTEQWRRWHLIHAAHHLSFLVPTLKPAAAHAASAPADRGRASGQTLDAPHP